MLAPCQWTLQNLHAVSHPHQGLAQPGSSARALGSPVESQLLRAARYMLEPWGWHGMTRDDTRSIPWIRQISLRGPSQAKNPNRSSAGKTNQLIHAWQTWRCHACARVRGDPSARSCGEIPRMQRIGFSISDLFTNPMEYR